MRGVRRFSGWPLGPAPVTVSALLIFVATLGSTWTKPSWPYQEWVLTSAAVHEQLLFVLPIAAAAATYYAGRLTSPSRIFSQSCAVRAGAPVSVRHLVTLTVPFLLAYILGLAPLLVLTIMRAESGGPALLPMVTGLLGMIAAIVAGYGIGVVARSA